MQKREMREKQYNVLKNEVSAMVKWYLENGFSLINENVLENKQAGKRVILKVN